MAFEIESGIEIPKVTRSSNGQEKYPFGDLEIGQSFFVADEGAALKKEREGTSNS